MTRQPSLAELCTLVRDNHLPVAVHSGKIEQGGVFVVMPAPVPEQAMDSTPGGEQYLADALSRAPGYIVLEERHLPLLKQLTGSGTGPQPILVASARKALGELARACYRTDSGCPRVVAITGTNGKTTETYLLESLFLNRGMKVGVIGTVAYRWPGHEEEAPLTTPDCLTLHSMLARMRDAGVEIAFMEVSSHAIDQERVAGIEFSAALLTNLTQDHLDYHQDMEDYFRTKARLFRDIDQGGLPMADKVKVVNADDPYCRRLLEELPEAIGFGLNQPVGTGPFLAGKIVEQSPDGLRLTMHFGGQQWEIHSPLVGGFNAMNLLGAQALGLGLGLSPEHFTALEKFAGVRGRLERIPNNQSLNVFVDYAHTPDALVKAISALRDAGFERIVTVFGCGGNRDRTKRPLMGQAVAGLTDVAVLTSDNPRFEDPDAIIADVLPGLKECKRYITEPDRKKALAEGLKLLGPNDALLVAGKGHETYQLIQGVKYPFSDQDTLRELMA